MNRPSSFKPLKNEKGVAMMMAMVTFLVLSVLVGELVYETGVYNSVVWRQVDQYRAKLMARSALRLALLQVRAAEKARAKAKSLGLGEGTSLTDQIWQTPLVLPPPSPPGFGEADSKSLDEFGKKLGLDGSLSISITGENSRMNLNQLVWLKEKTAIDGGGAAPPPESEEEKTKRLEVSRQGFVQFVDELLEQKRRTDDSFRDRYGAVRGELLVKNILAWIDPATLVDGDNQNKTEYYSRVEPYPYAIHNAPLAAESELYMIKGFDDTLANLFADTFTTQITGGINVNEVSNNLLRALIPELGELELERIQKRKEDDTLGGKFKDATDFWNFLATLGNFDEAKKRLDERGVTILGPETSYRVVITGKSGQATKTWTAKIGPLPPKSGELKTSAQPAQPQPGQPPNPSTQPQKNDSNSLNIIYLKAD